jgi:hypothetical protein
MYSTFNPLRSPHHMNRKQTYPLKKEYFKVKIEKCYNGIIDFFRCNNGINWHFIRKLIVSIL